jgi:hypothetical protein
VTLFNMVRNGRIRFQKDGNYVLGPSIHPLVQ